jgi:D-aminopeptidase
MMRRSLVWIAVMCAVWICCGAIMTAQTRPRARQLGIVAGIYPPGPLNGITDVEGVRVGHTTLIEGDDVRTGVTAVTYGWKGGIGTSSRIVPSGYVVGVLAQTNFGGNLTIAGVPIFQLLQPGKTIGGFREPDFHQASGDGSCMLIVATDAPIDPRDLGRLAARAVFGLGRTGSSYSNGSGDFAIAFSTSPEMRSRFGLTEPQLRRVLPTDAMSPLFQAALEATEEAVYNSLFQATTVTSKFGTAEAIPIDRVRELLRK